MPKMYKQTEDYYRDLMLGFGSGSIYNFGCYLVSLVNGLSKFGYEYTPRTFNQFLKDNNAFTGKYKNYIDVDRLDDILPSIFISYKKIDPCPDMSTIQWYLSRDYVVIAKVSAKGIGGIGSHFVFVDHIEKGVTWIYDPWFGDLRKVTDRYGKLGNLLSLRIFNVKKLSTESAGMTDKNADARQSRDHYWNIHSKVADIISIELKSEPDVDQIPDKVEALRKEAEKSHAELRSEVSNRVEQVSKLENRLLICSNDKLGLNIKLKEAQENVSVVEVSDPILVKQLEVTDHRLGLEIEARDEADKAKGRSLNELAKANQTIDELEKKNINLMKRRSVEMPATKVISALFSALWSKLSKTSIKFEE